MRSLLLCCLIVATVDVASAQCPALTVIGPAGVTNPGDEMEFRAEINVIGPKVEYSWSVNAGTIVKGQGTARIAVLTDASLAGRSVKATVDVGGLPQNCDRLASEMGGVDALPACGLPIDEWGEMKPNDERGRLDVFFAELMNNPDHVGVIILQVKAGEKLDPTNSRIQFVLRHVKFRKFNKSRIWFALEVAEEKSTKLYRMRPDTEPPCGNCVIYRGESL